MNALAAHNIASIFIYTNEAHPGESYRHLTSMEQKLRHARDLRDKLVDALDGACHRAYGSMPNMTWIFNRGMLPIYKADWTDINSVANSIDYFLDVSKRRKNRERLAPFNVERLDYHNQDRDAFYKGLERNGPKAVEEFRNAFG